MGLLTKEMLRLKRAAPNALHSDLIVGRNTIAHSAEVITPTTRKISCLQPVIALYFGRVLYLDACSIKQQIDDTP